MQTYRALTFSEASFVRPTTRETIGTSLELHGTIDEAALRLAFAALLGEYPILAAQIVTVDDQPHFAPGDPDSAAANGFHRHEEPWQGYVQVPPAEVGTTQLAALVITGDGALHRLTLWASHAATDGSGIIAILVRLCELYTAYAAGETPNLVHDTEFPTEPHEVMAARGHVPGELDYERRLAGTTWHGSMAAALTPYCAVDRDDALRLRFTAAQTTALAAAARHHGVSLHALVSAFIARAELAQSAPGTALALLTPVDFRGRLEPPIPLRSVTALCGFSYVAVSDGTAAGVARTVSDQIRSDVRDGTVLRAAVSPMPNPATRRHGPPVLISNIGVFPALALPAALRAVDFHSQIVRSAAGVAEYTAAWRGEGRPPVPIGSSYLISIFDERLSIEIRVLPGTLSDEVRERILERIEQEALAMLEVGSAA